MRVPVQMCGSAQEDCRCQKEAQRADECSEVREARIQGVAVAEDERADGRYTECDRPEHIEPHALPVLRPWFPVRFRAPQDQYRECAGDEEAQRALEVRVPHQVHLALDSVCVQRRAGTHIEQQGAEKLDDRREPLGANPDALLVRNGRVAAQYQLYERSAGEEPRADEERGICTRGTEQVRNARGRTECEEESSDNESPRLHAQSWTDQHGGSLEHGRVRCMEYVGVHSRSKVPVRVHLCATVV